MADKYRNNNDFVCHLQLNVYYEGHAKRILTLSVYVGIIEEDRRENVDASKTCAVSLNSSHSACNPL
jgi:hypothetical protein